MIPTRKNDIFSFVYLIPFEMLFAFWNLSGAFPRLQVHYSALNKLINAYSDSDGGTHKLWLHRCYCVQKYFPYGTDFSSEVIAFYNL